MAQTLGAGLGSLGVGVLHERGDVACGGRARDGPQPSGAPARARLGAAQPVNQIELARQGLGDRDRAPVLASTSERADAQPARLEVDVESAQRQRFGDSAPGVCECRGEGLHRGARVGADRGEEAGAFTRGEGLPAVGVEEREGDFLHGRASPDGAS